MDHLILHGRVEGLQVLGRELALLHERLQAVRAEGPQPYGQGRQEAPITMNRRSHSSSFTLPCVSPLAR